MDKNEHVILYTTDCPKCKILKEQLDRAGIKYETVTDVKGMLKKGMTTVPTLSVDNKMLAFTEAMEWLQD